MMTPFLLVDNTITEILAIPVTDQESLGSSVKMVQQTKSESNSRSNPKTLSGSKTLKGHSIKELKKNAYNEDPIVKDSLWNIYTGNPGFYVTQGDTINFGNVTTLSDSAFLRIQQTVVPKTIKPYGIEGKALIVSNQGWLLGIILILWMIFASVRVTFLNYLGQMFNSLFQ